jgi:hypothetical protein
MGSAEKIYGDRKGHMLFSKIPHTKRQEFSRSLSGNFTRDHAMFLENDMAADPPPASHRIAAARNLEQSNLARHFVSENVRYVSLDTGAAIAGDCDGISRGFSRNHQEGLCGTQANPRTDALRGSTTPGMEPIPRPRRERVRYDQDLALVDPSNSVASKRFPE